MTGVGSFGHGIDDVRLLCDWRLFLTSSNKTFTADPEEAPPDGRRGRVGPVTAP